MSLPKVQEIERERGIEDEHEDRSYILVTGANRLALFSFFFFFFF